MNIDLRGLRERMNLTQEQLANAMGLTQEQVSRLENKPSNMTMEMFLKLCEVSGISPNDLIKYKPNNPPPILFKDIYRDYRYKKDVFDHYLTSGCSKFSTNPNYDTALEQCIGLSDLVSKLGSKPVVAFVGPSDAGKSRLINILTGLDKMVAKWTPTTSTTVYIKHAKDKPGFMGDDNVWVFNSEADNRPWNSKNYNNEDYCLEHRIAGGGYDILRQYCTRDESGQSLKYVDAAVVFMDSRILHLCDLIDLPGFGTEDEYEDLISERGIEQADITVFLCQSNGFLNHAPDVVFLKQLILKLPVLEGVPLLSNLFIVASQAHIVNESIEDIFARGYKVLDSQFNKEVITNHFGVTAEEFMCNLSERFFSYSIENSLLRKDFEKELQTLLEEIMPPIRESIINDAIIEFKESSSSIFKTKLELSKKAIQDYENLKVQYEKQAENRTIFINTVQEKLKVLINVANNCKKEDCEKLRRWEKRAISSESILAIINEKQYDKKKAQEYLPSNVADLYYLQLQQLLKESTIVFHKHAQTAFEEMEYAGSELTKLSVNGVLIPFDMKGAVAGALASAGMLGGLSLTAASMGNLGGYILVAKGVSVLSALGISISGGTAGAISAVSAIGGPVTIAIGLGVAVFLLGKRVFGDSWKERLAKQLYKKMAEENYLSKYESNIIKYWDDTINSINHVTKTIVDRYDTHMKYIEEMLNDNNPDIFADQIALNSEIANFFEGIPWNES